MATMIRSRCSESRYPRPPEARRCWSRPREFAGWGDKPGAPPPRRNPIGTNSDSGPAPARGDGAASPRCLRARPGGVRHSRPPCSPTRTARRSARPSGAGISASRLADGAACWSMNCPRSSKRRLSSEIRFLRDGHGEPGDRGGQAHTGPGWRRASRWQPWALRMTSDPALPGLRPAPRWARPMRLRFLRLAGAGGSASSPARCRRRRLPVARAAAPRRSPDGGDLPGAGTR